MPRGLVFLALVITLDILGATSANHFLVTFLSLTFPRQEGPV